MTPFIVASFVFSVIGLSPFIFTASAIAATNPFSCLSDVLPASIRYFLENDFVAELYELLIHSQATMACSVIYALNDLHIFIIFPI
jgi:hypothetical protein